MPHEHPIVERIRLAVRQLMHQHGITQRAIAQRLNIAAIANGICLNQKLC